MQLNKEKIIKAINSNSKVGMRIQRGKYQAEPEESAIVSGIIIEEPNIVINEDGELAGLSWMLIREYNYVECEVIIRSKRLTGYCKENKEKLEIGKKVKLRGALIKGEEMDYMLLNNYGEITPCETYEGKGGE